jgi:hypothetical protein
MHKLSRCIFVLLFASSALAHADEGEEEDEVSEFVRTGFYIGVGGTAAFGANWDDDYDNDLNDDLTALANANAQENSPGKAIVPLSVVTVDGADLEDAVFGANAVFGYRAGEVVAFEVEGEWLISENKSNLNVSANETLVQESTGKHKVEVKDVWTLTANVKAYAPFEIFTGRFQPFAKVGLGAQNSKVITNISTSGLTTLNAAQMIVPADFEFRQSKSSLDGALRVGGGIDIYATRNVVAELNTTYVVPFSKAGSMRTDYVSVQWRLVYRF